MNCNSLGLIRSFNSTTCLWKSWCYYTSWPISNTYYAWAALFLLSGTSALTRFSYRTEYMKNLQDIHLITKNYSKTTWNLVHLWYQANCSTAASARPWGGQWCPLCFESFKLLQSDIKCCFPCQRVIQTYLHYTRCDPVMNQVNISPLRCRRYPREALSMKTLNASYSAGRAKEVRTSRNLNHKFKLSGVWNYFTQSYILTAHSPNTLRCWHFHPD